MEKGAPILSFRSGIPKSAWWLLAALALYLVVFSVRFAEGRNPRWLDAAPVFVPVAGVAATTLRRTVRIYENGIWVPAAQDKTPARFLTWSQIDRFQFEGDSLYLAGTQSMLNGGPVQSATLLVPQNVQAPVMSVLAGHVGLTSR